MSSAALQLFLTAGSAKLDQASQTPEDEIFLTGFQKKTGVLPPPVEVSHSDLRED